MDSSDKKAPFWNSFLRAVEAEPRSVRTVIGASGLEHPCMAFGVDDARNRIIVISSEPDGRTAALVQADIQAQNPKSHVIVSRPIAVNLRRLAETVTGMLGRDSFVLSDLKGPVDGTPEKAAFDKRIVDIATLGLQPTIKAISYAPLDWVGLIQEAIRQLSHLRIDTTGELANAKPEESILRVGPIVALDPAEGDIKSGICFVPLYDFSEVEAELFQKGDRVDDVRDVLRTHHLLQYFFPPPDQLALGLVERQASTGRALEASLDRPLEMGHPLGPVELVAPETRLASILDALQDKGLVVEGEIGLELSDAGKTVRATVKYKPREGFLAKLARVLSLKVDLSLKDLLNIKP